MRHAPSVIYPVGRSRAVIALVAGVWSIGICGVVLTSVQLPEVGWRQAVLAACAIVAGLVAWRGLPSHSDRHLVFDGQHWSVGSDSLAPAPQIVAVEVALDLQFVMLLRLSTSMRSVRWLWLSRHPMPSRWRDLRRAVYSRAPSLSPSPSDWRAAPVDRG